MQKVWIQRCEWMGVARRGASWRWPPKTCGQFNTAKLTSLNMASQINPINQKSLEPAITRSNCTFFYLLWMTRHPDTSLGIHLISPAEFFPQVHMMTYGSGLGHGRGKRDTGTIYLFLKKRILLMTSRLLHRNSGRYNVVLAWLFCSDFSATCWPLFVK